MSDFEKILNLVGRLGRAFDESNLEEFAACWDEAGVLTLMSAGVNDPAKAIRGRADIVAFARQAFAAGASPSRHFVSLPVIDIDGDRAVARYYNLYPYATETPALPGLGDYRTVARRQADGGWKIIEQTLNKLSVTRQDVAFKT